jgi:hypothetical protein
LKLNFVIEFELFSSFEVVINSLLSHRKKKNENENISLLFSMFFAFLNFEVFFAEADDSEFDF